MTPQRHQRLMDLFDQACDLAPREQEALLSRLWQEDAELAQSLGKLLHHDRAAPDGLDAGALQGGLELTLPQGDVPPEPDDLQDLPDLPDLDVRRLLAEGGMGRVLLAWQRSLRREVAVKVVRQGGIAPLLAEGLFAEAILSGSLEHPNIIPIHLLQKDPQGLPVLVMKRVEGVSWATLLARPEHPMWAQVAVGEDRLGAHLSILGSVCNALHFAHSRGVIHRDVKPDNVMVGSFGEVYLLDWGIAVRHAAQGPARNQGIVGTPGYMPPEMAVPGGSAAIVRGAAPCAAPCIDRRTDVYLLGATLHEVLTGQVRHSGNTLEEVLQAARRSAPHLYGPHVPEELAVICNRATHADPAERFDSAAAFRDALLDYQRHRAAVVLCEAATVRLRQVQALLGRPSQSASHTDSTALNSHVRELIIESQFGFRESLRVWPGNASATTGLRDCLIAATEYELAMDNLSAARSLLKQVQDPPADLVAQVEALRQRVREQKEREVRLREIERGLDWSVAARARVAMMLLAMGLSVTVWRFMVAGQGAATRPIPPIDQALGVVVVLAALGMVLVVFRRSLLATQVNRQAVLGLFCCMSGMAVSRGLFALPAPTTATLVSVDQVLGATVAAVGGVVLARWLWLLVPVFLCGAVAARCWPTESGISLLISGTVSVAIGFVCMGRAAQKPQPAEKGI